MSRGHGCRGEFLQTVLRHTRHGPTCKRSDETARETCSVLLLRQDAHKFYQAQAKLIWNGLEFNGREAIAKHLTSLPATRHNLYSLDLFPMKGTARRETSLQSIARVLFRSISRRASHLSGVHQRCCDLRFIGHAIGAERKTTLLTRLRPHCRHEFIRMGHCQRMLSFPRVICVHLFFFRIQINKQEFNVLH